MKTLKHISQLLLLFIAFSTSAQQGINYKAIIKDVSGNVVANDLIVVQFQILQGVGMTNVYQETHNPTTDANGYVIINIGEGKVDSGVFGDIDWSSDEHHLNVQIDTGGGLTDMGTTQFMAVPYAFQSDQAGLANRLALKSGVANEFSVEYDSPEDKLKITEVGVSGNVFEISNGEITLPQYAGSSTENISVDSNGKLIKTSPPVVTPKNNQKFGIYDYFDVDSSSPNFTISKTNTHFQDGTILIGISALLLDNDSGTGGVNNSNFVVLKRASRNSLGSGGAQEIYRITGNNTAASIYNQQSSFTLVTSGANVIDNSTYIYYFEIYTCASCDFGEVSVFD
ncbi:MAG: hypothetical protein KJO49_04855 [Bacteroidia bacterium]|nr:hypothetical protein [Bacteroidia bacterium]